MLLAHPQRAVVLAATAVATGPLLLWLYSRTAGLPFGPAVGRPLAIGPPDPVAIALEIAAVHDHGS